MTYRLIAMLGIGPFSVQECRIVSSAIESGHVVFMVRMLRRVSAWTQSSVGFLERLAESHAVRRRAPQHIPAKCPSRRGVSSQYRIADASAVFLQALPGTPITSGVASVKLERNNSLFQMGGRNPRTPYSTHHRIISVW